MSEFDGRTMRSWVVEVGVATGVIIGLFNHVHRGGSVISIFRWQNLVLFVGTVAFTAALSYVVAVIFRRLGFLGFRDDDARR